MSYGGQQQCQGSADRRGLELVTAPLHSQLENRPASINCLAALAKVVKLSIEAPGSGPLGDDPSPCLALQPVAVMFPRASQEHTQVA